MKKDIIQRTLEVMERINPSRNPHPKSFIGKIKDKIYFLRRAYFGAVESYIPFSYDPNAIWYDRLKAVKEVAVSCVDTKKFIEDLESISEKDDDWRVREVVDNLLHDCLEKNCVVTC